MMWMTMMNDMKGQAGNLIVVLVLLIGFTVLFVIAFRHEHCKMNVRISLSSDGTGLKDEGSTVSTTCKKCYNPHLGAGQKLHGAGKR